MARRGMSPRGFAMQSFLGGTMSPYSGAIQGPPEMNTQGDFGPVASGGQGSQQMTPLASSGQMPAVVAGQTAPNAGGLDPMAGSANWTIGQWKDYYLKNMGLSVPKTNNLKQSLGYQQSKQ